MSKLLPYVLIMLSSIVAIAQQNVTLSGTLLDEETNEPLIFASIGLQGSPIGTISNASGEFDFHISRQEATDGVIEISMLGYEVLAMKISLLGIKKPLTFYLKKVPQVLDEVVISDSLTSADILEIAVNKIPINYPDKPFLLDGFYRDTKSVNGTYISLLEAAIQVFDHNYEAPRNPTKLREKVGLNRIRKSLGYNHKYAGFFDQGNLLEEMLTANVVRYRTIASPQAANSNIKRLPESNLFGLKVYVIDYRYDNVKLKLFISQDDFAFLRVEQTIGNQGQAISENLKYKKYLYLDRFVTMQKVLEFKPYAGKYFLHYFTRYKRNQWYNQESRRLDYDMEVYQELLVNNIHENTDLRIDNKEKMKKYGLQYQDLPYDADFWKNYNVIKQTPLDKKIVEDLEQYGTLEYQFGGN